MLTVCASMKRARALITRTFSMLSSLAKLAARSLGIRPFLACMAALNTASPLSAQAARRWPSTSSFLEGMQPMLMQVPPYIWSEASTRITSWPCWARSAASVLPALPKPMIRFWVESVCMMNREKSRRKEEGSHRAAEHLSVPWIHRSVMRIHGTQTDRCPTGMPQRVHVSTAPLRNERARWQPGNSMGSKIAAYPLRRFNRTFRILSPRACEPMIGRIGGMSDSGRCVRP